MPPWLPETPRSGDGTMAGPERLWLRTTLHSALWLVLGGWIGSFGLFALVIARTAFEVLPSTEVAGQLVGPVLSAIHLYGAAAGLGTALIALAMGRRGLPVGLPLILMVACLYTQFGVSAEIAEIRPMVFGPEGDADAAGRWQVLHRRSMIIFSAVWLGSMALLVLHARIDARNAQHT